MGGSSCDPPGQGADAGLRLRLSRRIEIHGHRGARGLAPENTLGGFLQALAIGVDALELDVGLTADGVVVVTHDPAPNPDLTRDSSGAWIDAPGAPVFKRHYAEIAQFDVGRIRPGSAYAARYPAQLAQDGARIPTLAEVIALDGRVHLNIEIKSVPSPPGVTAPPGVMADAVVAMLGAAVARANLQAFDWRVLRHLQRHHPGIALAWLTEAKTVADPATWWDMPAAPVPEAVATAGGQCWAPFFGDLTEAGLARARRLGLRVTPWTVNEPADMARLIGWGVDGIITDRPDLLRAELETAGLPIPAPRREFRD